jgi:tRNA uracil 4-sulfurtransferase
MDKTDKIMIRVGEIFLKGKNRGIFEKKLLENVKSISGQEVKKSRFRFIINYFPEHLILKRVFGLTSYSICVETEKDLDEISKKAVSLLKGKIGHFKVETKRSDKTFPSTSPEISRKVGEYIENNLPIKFSLKDPQFILHIEINNEGAFLFLDTFKCFGGLPVGVEGKALLLAENEKDLLAGLEFMRRGTEISIVYNKEINIELLQKYSPKKIKAIKFDSIKEIEQLASNNNVSILISGQNYSSYQKINTSLLVFRPLIAYSDQEIKEKLSLY